MRKFVKLAFAGCAAAFTMASGAMADGMPAARGGSIKDAPIPRAMSWSGIYVGGQIGAGWSDLSHDITFANGNRELFTFDPSSFVGGVQAGIQRQLGQIVIGLEANLIGGDFAEQHRSLTAASNVVRKSDIDWLFTLTPRLGFAVDNWMIYIKGGYASAEVFRGTARIDNGNLLTGNNRREDGWTLGTGFEVAVAPNVSLGLDYSYVNLDTKARPTQFVATGVTLGTARLSEVDMHLVTARINFKLGH